MLRGRCELPAEEAGKIGRAVNGGTNSLGATPESGVVKNEVEGLNALGENVDAAVESENTLCKEVMLCEWNGPCLLLMSW